MPKPNYQFEKRQRDLAKKQKQEEKRREKLASKTASTRTPHADVPADDGMQESGSKDSALASE